MEVKKSMGESKSELWLSVQKPLGFHWLMDACFYIQSMKEMIVNDFHEAGITDTLAGIV